MNFKTIHQELAALKGITFCSQNIRSLHQKLDEVKILLQQTNIDFALFQETFLNESYNSSDLEVSNYNIFRLDRANNTTKLGGGGLLCYASTKYQVEYLADWSIITGDLEIQWLKLCLPETRPTYIGNLYRPPSGNINSALSIIENKLDLLHSEGIHDVLLMGDMNIDLLKKSPSSSKLNTFCRNNILTQQIRKPTRYSNTGSTLLDHALTNNDDFYNLCGVVDLGLSDHCLVCIYVERDRS